MKKSEWRTDGAVFTHVLEAVGEDGRTYRERLRASRHKRHSPWTDCPTCLGKHHKMRKVHVKRQKDARRTNRG